MPSHPHSIWCYLAIRTLPPTSDASCCLLIAKRKNCSGDDEACECGKFWNSWRHRARLLFSIHRSLALFRSFFSLFFSERTPRLPRTSGKAPESRGKFNFMNDFLSLFAADVIEFVWNSFSTSHITRNSELDFINICRQKKTREKTRNDM